MLPFQQLQHAFIAHIKDPSHAPVPEGIADERMAVYRELFFNNVQGFVSSAFPVLKSLYNAEDWQALVRQFFANYQCSSPYFLHIAEHFLSFLQQDYQLQVQDPVFMRELAHYEWAELYLATKLVPQAEHALSADAVLTQPLQLSALALILAYPYAVHQISVSYQPQQSGELHCYLLYRNKEDMVKFVAINQLTAALLQLLQQQPGATLNQLVDGLLPLLPQYGKAQLLAGASSVLADFATKGVLVSFQAAQNSLP